MMQDFDSETVISELVAGAGRRLSNSPMWLYVHGSEPLAARHGWKLHISSRAMDFQGLLRVAVPILLAEGCSFKLARSTAVLRDINDGAESPATVGKAMTVYPEQTRAVILGRQLAAALRGLKGPRVLSDRRVDPEAPVYYRYGPFSSDVVQSPTGRLVSTIRGPNGDDFEGSATLDYRQPSWISDPFVPPPTGNPDSVLGAQDGPNILGNHYRLRDGVMQSPRGNVYRAVDLRDGTPVVIKQGRTYVAESSDGFDARMRLRNERRVLQALEKVSGVVRCLDHFRHGDEEYLVVEDGGTRNLVEDILHHGRYPLEARPGGRSLERFANELGETLSRVHGAEVLVRDLSAKNVVIKEDGGVTLIDFGISYYRALHIPGGTPGFSPARQMRGQSPTQGDDLHGLGMTLFFAATGIMPVADAADLDFARRSALGSLRTLYGARSPVLIATIAELLSSDDERAGDAFRAISGGQLQTQRPPMALARAPEVKPEDLPELTSAVLADLMNDLRELLDEGAEVQPLLEAPIYGGLAGMGLELLHHVEQPGVRGVLEAMAAQITLAMHRIPHHPGLLVGSTGVQIFLERLRAQGFQTEVLPREMVEPGADWTPEGDDLLAGAAGVGLGHLLLGALDPHPAHREIAWSCVARVAERSVPRSNFPCDVLPDSAGLDVEAGFAHGQAGIVQFLVAALRFGLDPVICKDLERRIDWAKARVPALIVRAREPGALPLSASWCRGLAGMGRALLRAGETLNDPELLELALNCGLACKPWIPYLSNLGQCCGVAGVGSFLVDLAVTVGDERIWTSAYATASQWRLRADCKLRETAARDASLRMRNLSWSFGRAGILAFFRGLRDRAGADEITLATHLRLRETFV